MKTLTKAQHDYFKSELDAVARNKGHAAWNVGLSKTAPVRSAERLVARWNAKNERLRTRARAKVDVAVRHCREMLLFGDEKQVRTAFNELRKLKF